MFKVMADNNLDISAGQDGALYNIALNNTDFIVKGLGNEMAMSYSGRTVTVGTGIALSHGRHVLAAESNQLTLPTNTSGYLVLRIDLSNSVGVEGYLLATPVLVKNEINWGGSVYDMPLAQFTTNSSTVTSFKDMRNVKDNVLDNRLNGLNFIAMTTAQYNALGSWDPKALYFLTD